MKLANTSKRVLPWFAVIIFLIVPILMMMNLLRPHLFDPEFVWIDYSYFEIATLRIPLHRVEAFAANALTVFPFFLIAIISAAVLGISGKHRYFPTVLGAYILLSMLPILVQTCLYGFRQIFHFSGVMYYWCFSQNFLFTQSISRLIYCLPVCVLAVYMIIAPFCKFKGWVMPVVTVAVILLTLVATLILSFPLDFLQALTGRGRNILETFAYGIPFNEIWTAYKMNRLFKEGSLIIEILCTSGILFFQYAGFLLYLPAALHNPKTPKTEA